jgi:hypothetical protein
MSEATNILILQGLLSTILNGRLGLLVNLEEEAVGVVNWRPVSMIPSDVQIA